MGSPQSDLVESLKKNSFFAEELRTQFIQKLHHYWILSIHESRSSGFIGVVGGASYIHFEIFFGQQDLAYRLDDHDACGFSTVSFFIFKSFSPFFARRFRPSTTLSGDNTLWQ